VGWSAEAGVDRDSPTRLASLATLPIKGRETPAYRPPPAAGATTTFFASVIT